jgi:hypothetical protein
LALWSDDVSNAAWGFKSGAVAVDYQTIDFQTPTAYFGQNYTHNIGFFVSITREVEVKSGTKTGTLLFTLFGGAQIVITLTDEWQKVTLVGNSKNTNSDYVAFQNTGDGSTGTVLVRNARGYRSDLGGMVDNPDRGDSYVPTTTSARYLPRRGHHVYNGSAWVNEGLLVESEARINLAGYNRPFTAVSVIAPPSYQWSIAGGSGVVNNTTEIGVDGISGAANISLGTAGGFDFYKRFGSLTPGDSFTFSIPVKLGTATNFVIAANNGIAWDTVGGKEFTASDGLSTDKFTRVHYTDIVPASGNINIHIGKHNETGVATQTTGTVIVDYDQFEIGSTPSSHIINLGTGSVTRAAETLTVPAAQLPWPEPNVIGSELVTAPYVNSTVLPWPSFSASSEGFTASVSDSFGSYTAVASTAISATASKVYKVDIVVIESTDNSVTCRLQADPGGGGVSKSSLFTFGPVATQTTITGYITATATDDLYLQFGLSATTATLEVASVSVKEIDPLSVSIQMDGRMTYADDGTNVILSRWYLGSSNYIENSIGTNGGYTGRFVTLQSSSGVVDFKDLQGAYSPGINVPYNIASRHGSTFINGAVDGTALTANTTPTALPDLSTTDLNLAYDYMGTVKLFRVWANDLGDDGIATASTPEAPDIPANAITQRDGSYILDRSGSYIETRA